MVTGSRLLRAISAPLWTSLALLGAWPDPAAAVSPFREKTVVIRGSVPPAARPERDRGAVDPDTALERMTLPLARRPGTDADLARMLAEQQDPGSLNFHRWLTPAEFGRRFGASDRDVQSVVDWLSASGFRIDEVARGRGWITFSGTVRQAEEAFETSIRKFEARGRMFQSNATEIAFPASIARLVAGPVPLNNFHSRPMHIRREVPAEVAGPPRPEQATPLFNSGPDTHYLAPADFSKIYNTGPLFAAGTTGAGAKVAIAARTNIHLSDVQRFRSQFGLPPSDPQLVINGTDPGVVSDDEEGEAELDAEWSGAVAPGAEIDLVITADTNATDGIQESSQYIVDHNVAPIATLSFGLCEQFPQTLIFNGLWSQAAAEGISVFVASGDSGVADCDDDPKQTTATHGPSVNGMCSTASNVCVGGTQFLDTANPAGFWASANDPVTKASALSYIPEMAWNESGSSCGALCATGGGASVVYPKPSWQIVAGIPPDNHRYVPDVSVNGATHDAYLTYVNNSSSLSAFGGTSASSPALAGLMAMVVQKFGPQGNPNPRLYQLGAAQFSGAPLAVFHDVALGDNTVPGQTGLSAGPGYDQTTGLGSIDAGALVANWAAAPPPTAQRTPPVLVGPNRTPRLRPFR